MNKKLLSTGVALVAAAITLSGCATAESVSAPSTSTSAPVTSAADEAIRHVVGLGATGLDATAARAALESGRPYLVGLPDGASVACHTALLVPGSAAPWILNAAIKAEGAALETDYAQVGCSGRSVPASTTPSAPIAPMDTAAAEAAQREGKPFIYAIPNGTNPTCNVAVRLTDGTEWFLNRSTGPTKRGNELGRVQKQYGCTNGEVVPGVPAGN
ncbi:hypothetical protein [Mycobacteroides abscessus]|uniref:hypothetical protein n=1 Tax=Mycobacteroides abscessus TaxID=36809 RepID=UPI00078BDC53|nr:hypothetical protein [Mycobacteroides abscessus]AMU49393.1 hypothetical protein A3O01_03960 [Mycobacteroides abscessus]ANO08065.1 hypothetical protein BAB76_03960 [Mycobacteroides abscessus]MDM3921127.1 hypothetical protein [Mycobacteroides abscessus]MDO2965032.1 hypothetical protein [Mycobacteroides abscessus subsp. abscessus]MDO3260247.1 hypothetical protein [Mycobacteroides abscessus subsp. abscessus]